MLTDKDFRTLLLEETSGLRRISRPLVAVIVAVAVPTIGCVCYYTAVALGGADTFPLHYLLAYPAALVSLIGLVTALFSRRRFSKLLWVSGLSLCVAMALLLIPRLDTLLR